jgi:hypothetical protein
MGKINIFVRTDHPKLAFEKIKLLIGTKDFMPDLKVAFRDVGGNNFVILHPHNVAQFEL